MAPDGSGSGRRGLSSARWGLALAEDRGADPDMGRAEPNRGLVVRRHTHAELVETVSPGDFGEQRERKRRFFVDRRDAHQPDD